MRHPTVQGIGINDAEYSVGSGKDICPYYATWLSMFSRVYNPKSLAKNPTYVGCSVAPEWHSFMAFRNWMEGQDWMGKQLDKDLLVPGNKVYGPTTCLFVTHHINGLLATQPKLRGELPIGVVRHGNKFKVTFKKERKTRHIGVYSTIEEAAFAYKQEKAAWIRQVALKETCARTQEVLLRAAESLESSL